MGEIPVPSGASRHYWVRREKLERAFLQTRPDVVFVVSPGGYGKTVLARQLAASATGEVLWLSMGGGSPSSADLPSALSLAITTDRQSGRGASIASAVMADNGWDRLDEALDGLEQRPAVLVIDGLDALSSSEFIYDLLDRCRRAFSHTLQIIVTCRTRDADDAPRSSDVSQWCIDRTLLEFDLQETIELATHLLQREVTAHEAQVLATSSAGQPALLLLILRNITLSGRDVDAVLSSATGDVAAHLRSLVSRDTPWPVLSVLRVAAMLRHGNLRQLTEMAGVAVEAVYQAVDLMPLLRVTGAKGTLRGFEMHDLACEVLCGLLVSRESCHTQALSQVVHELAGRREYDWMFDVLVASGDVDMMLEWIELLGLCMIEEARLDLLESVLDQVPAIVQAGSPRLLLIAALLHRSKGRTSQAFTLASAARRAAEVASDERGAIECLMVEIRLHWDVADYETILPRMGEALARAQGRGDNDTTAMLLGYMASAYAQLGDVKRGREYALKYREASRLPGVQSATKVQALQPVLFVLGFVAGDIALAASMLREARAEAKYPRALALQCDANLASLVLEMGRVTSAMRMISSVGVHLQASGFSILSDACSGTEGAIRAAMGDKPEAESLLRAAVEDALCPDDRLSVECNRLYRSAIRRATGSVDEALSDSEDAHAAFSDDGSGLPVMRCLAKIEMAANLLALGDLRRAEELASVAHRDASLWTAAYHLLRADMVLAEIERQQGAFDEAIARIAQHREYILTESANWQIAMYIRAFPGLLGVFAKAVGVDALPSHLLRMILHDYARPALDACHDELPTADMERLAARLLGKRAAAVFMRERASGPKAVVRLFGGMQVVTPTGAVTDKDWRKRKARLLFALLVLRRGQDMPREQIFEHFWPEMDEERAKSNFYVTWSIMKRALAAGTGGKGPCPYVEHVGGVCRVVPALISSDFAEFEDALTAMRKADRAGDASLALAAAERIVEQYRGELLPGELYDDWLGPIRDRCRHDYGDAMLRASQLTYEAGDSEKALHLVRAGLGQDPWREDLYQAALRYLIHTGQRSGAIETYVACKSKLAEDLGLDPSTETQRLYDQILAMEDPPGAPAPG